MASSLGVWTLLLILYQTIICVTISWFTLQCQLAPKSNELREATLMKLLYLYDPESCGVVHFYNFTLLGKHDSYTNIMWPVKNPVAASFRRKMQIWLVLHIIWLALSIINVSQSQQSCGFYMTLLPFSLCGITMLAVDIIFMVLFLEDMAYTRNEIEILKYINSDLSNLRWVREKKPFKQMDEQFPREDTTWLPLMFAYGSCRGVLQWLVNCWLVKDNYFEGLALYRHQRREKYK